MELHKFKGRKYKSLKKFGRPLSFVKYENIKKPLGWSMENIRMFFVTERNQKTLVDGGPFVKDRNTRVFK